MTSGTFTTADIIKFFVAFGTCAAVLVALYAKKQSSFESTFSLLLAQHNQALKDLKSSSDYTPNANDILDGLSPLIKQNKFMHTLDDFYGSYFRILYHLLKFIDNNAGYHPFDIKSKKEYTSLVRSHLDNTLTFLLAVNCSHASPENQYFNYKILIERYAMLEHLILDNATLTKYKPSNTNDHLQSINTLKIILNENLKTIFHDIVKVYNKDAFGTNPGLKKYL